MDTAVQNQMMTKWEAKDHEILREILPSVFLSPQ